MAEETRQFEGNFWLAGRSQETHPGFLRVGPQCSPTVEVAGHLIPPMRETSRTITPDGNLEITSVPDTRPSPVTIHGRDEQDRALTLIDALTVHRAWNPFDSTDEIPKQILEGNVAVVGGHISGREHEFQGFRIRVQRLEAWQSLLAESAWPQEARLADGSTISLEAGDEVWLRGKAILPCDVRRLDRRFVRPLISLFTLATGLPCDLVALRVQETPDGPWLDVYSSAQRTGDVNYAQPGPRWLLMPADLNMQHVCTWLDQAERFGPLPPVVADLASADSVAIETQVLQLTTVAEGIHRALFPDEQRFNKKTTDPLREAAVTAVMALNPGVATVVGSLLAFLHEPGYAQRIKRLAEVASICVPEATGKLSKWKTLVVSARNDFAHRLRTSFLSSDDLDAYLTVAFSLRWLLTAVLLLQVNIDAAVLAERFGGYEQYQLFLEYAQTWQPKIYAAT